MAFWQLGRLPLLDVDEPVYGEVGKEMAGAGWPGWLTPHYNGGLWFDKPPLFYWLTALSMRLLGVSEWSARLPSALLGVALVAVTYALARRISPWSSRAALWAGFVLATTVQFFLVARAAVTDMTLAVTLAGALLAVYCWQETGRGRWMAGAGLLTGLATLTKGPVALVLIGVQVVAFLVLTRQPKRLLSPALWGGLMLCLLVALPWYLAMIHLHGSLFIQGFLEANNVTRYLKPEHKETQNVFYYVPIFVALFLPWTLALPGVLVGAARRIGQEWREPGSPQGALFLGFWATLVFVFFSASQTKLMTYIFPMFPAAAILVGERLADWTPPGKRDRLSVLFATLLVAFALLLGVLGHKYHVASMTIGLWLVVLLGGATLSVLLPTPRRRWAVPGIAFALTLLAAWSSPSWREQASEVSDQGAAQAAARITPAGGEFYALGLKHPSLVYYSGRRVVYTDDRPQALQALSQPPGHALVVRPKVLDELHDKYGLTRYRVIYSARQVRVIEAIPPVVSEPRERDRNKPRL